MYPHYTSLAFDSVMRKGPDCDFYARPYLWMLENASGDTRFVAFSFPIIVHYAFGSREPVLVFRKAFERAWQLSNLRNLIRQLPGNINFAWLVAWNDIITEAVLPTLRETHMPNYTSGFDVIQRGKLSEHPIFNKYLTETKPTRGDLKLRYFNLKEPKNDDERLTNALVNMPFQDVSSGLLPPTNPFYQLSVVFGLPGQPLYRLLLGQYLTPPRVKFQNFTYNKYRVLTINGMPKVERYETDMDNLIVRVQHFRNIAKKPKSNNRG